MFLLKAIILFAYFVRSLSLQKKVCPKVEYSFSRKFEQPQKRYKNSNSIEACNYFDNWNHVLQGKFTSIEQYRAYINKALKQRLKDEEKY